MLSPQWYEDPIFDNTQDSFCRKNFYGDDWRRLQCLKEECKVQHLICLAGTSFYQEGIQLASEKRGLDIKLVAEDNKFDPNATRVDVNGETVGYIPKGMSVNLRQKYHMVKWGFDTKKPHVWIAY